MGLLDYLLIGLIVLLVGFAAFYIIRAKKGQKCIGCPYSKSCTKCNCNIE